MTRLKSLWRNLTRKQQVDDDLDAELRSYRTLLEDEKVRGGMPPDRARREARLEMGTHDGIKEEVRDIRRGGLFIALGAELRQSWRGLWRNPGLTVLGTLMLALGMSASITVFSVFYAALVQPLPFRDLDHLVQMWETRLDRGFDQASFTHANFWDVRARNRSFTDVAAIRFDEANLTGSGPAEKVDMIFTSAGLFRTLGVAPKLGRDFVEGEEGVVLVGEKFWKTRLGGEATILGTTLRLNDRAYTVVGVLPHGEPWLEGQLYVPLVYRADANRGSFECTVIGRLKPGVSAAAARGDLQRVGGELAAAYPEFDRGIGFRMDPAGVWVAPDTTRRALWVLLAAVTLLLLIACLNIANLLLARGTARQREIAVRTALGAGRARLARFVVMESLLLSGLGCALGLGLAYVALRALRSLEVSGIPRLSEASFNPWVLGFAVLIALLTGLLCGLAPALQAPAGHIVTALRDGERQTGSRRQGRVLAILVTSEVALSFMLLVGAGLLIRSFAQLLNVPHGFETQNRLLFSVSMPSSYWQKGVGKQFLDRFFEQLHATPGVIAAGAVNQRPVEGSNPGMGIDTAHGPGLPAPPWAGWRIVTPGYFAAVGVKVTRGRGFEETDKPVWQEKDQPEPYRRVIISEALAKLIFPREDAVGRRVLLWKGQGKSEAEVIGIAADSHERGLARPAALTVYLPYGRNALVQEFVLHTQGNPLAMVPAVRALVGKLDPNLPVGGVRSFEEVVQRSVAPQRLSSLLLALFAGLALILATTGIYGVLSYSISRRTSEIGLRMALGASRGRVLQMTLGQGLWPALVGIAVGVVGAGWLSKYLATLLFGVEPLDVTTYSLVALLLLATALVACYLPGRRAMQTDPAVALRTD